MITQHFLFLTNNYSDLPELKELKEEFQNVFNYAVHSTETRTENIFDLRNFARISHLLTDKTKVIFRLKNDLALYAANQFLDYDKNLNRRFIYLSSLSIELLSKNNPMFITNKICKKLIANRYSNSVVISSRLVEDKSFGGKRHFSETLDNNSLNIKSVLQQIISLEIQSALSEEEYVITNSKFTNKQEAANKKRSFHELNRPANYPWGKRIKKYFDKKKELINNPEAQIIRIKKPAMESSGNISI